MSAIEELTALDKSCLPKHIAIIMDGNGRWAKSRGKPRAFGHKAGVESVRNAVRFCRKFGIDALTVFAFSSENWNRPESEVSMLMELFMLVLKQEVKNLHKNNVQLRIIGDISGFNKRLQKQIANAQELTKDNTGLIFNVAANYGGRWDITRAAKAMAQDVVEQKLSVDDITEQTLNQYTATADLPELDLMIRTSGEHRISNFLLWQAAYAEFYFAEEHWPDFDDEVFAKAIMCYANRDRRFGLTGEQIEK
ncbi:di-trans,poly-cis-decaprenylcistransferase [Saccharobesus litoralis]|uniref:Ditrans,polycis-undecaprenyl-diphosphate synthase ((2E,6E)-farnesyl-diphosphate specific) n=2 Tax=Saccharobesus litoralis TaxID=2172099 RepID=A0A2S0VVA3_9ALTE|nr:isoprenyl transferase [Saccharobesus litoralis]AWB68147.1 di-trans,poly-cis-decaprenylcistransferase [Saccharobesus litoralis]